VLIIVLAYIISPYDNPWIFRAKVKKYLAIPTPHERGTLFLGSSIIQFWKSLGTDLECLSPVNRGLAGAKIGEIGHFTGDLVKSVKPSSVVIYAGSNDIQGRKPRTAEGVLEGLKKIIEQIHLIDSSIEVYYLSILPSAARTRLRHVDTVNEANRIIEDYCSEWEGLTFIDAVPLFSSEGLIQEHFYKKDKIHLTDQGYRILAQLILSSLKRP